MFSHKIIIFKYGIIKHMCKFKSCSIKTSTKSICQNVFKRSFCGYPRTLHPVQLAYASYESTLPDINEASSPPIIILHGLLGSKSNWNSLSKKIHHNTKRKIIAIDSRNHGDSPHSDDFTYLHMAEDLHLFMKNMNLEKVTLLGHSMGGRTVMMFALKYPQLVHSLIVVDISPVRIGSNIVEMTKLFTAMLAINLNFTEPMSKARKIVEEQLLESVPDAYVRQFLLTNLVQIPGGTYQWRVNLNAVVKNFPEIMKFPVAKDVYNGPVLFIGGKKSNFLKPDDHNGIQKFFPNADFNYIEGAGHWVHFDKPSEFLSIVCEFINDSNR